MSDVKWIKLSINVFDDEKFDAIRTLPDSNDIQLVWVKILCLAGKCNESGFLMLTSEIPYTDEMLANKFGMEIGVVQRALGIFQKLNMMDLIDNVYLVSNWKKYQSLDAYENKKAYDREYQKKRREKAKQLLEDKKSYDGRTTVVRNCSYISSSNNINNKENDKNIDSDIDTIKNIVSYLNKICSTRYRHNNETTKKHIRARLKEGFTEEDFYTVIDKKFAQWGSDPKMADYLRPQTLFGTKFESYLNQKVSENKPFSIDDWS